MNDDAKVKMTSDELLDPTVLYARTRLKTYDFLLGLAAVLAVFIGLSYLLDLLFRFPESSFFAPVLFFEVVGQFTRGRSIVHLAELVLLCGSISWLAIRYPASLWKAWRDVEHGSQLRLFVSVIAGIITWVYTTYDVNGYAGNAHYVDRLLLLAAFGLTIWRPAASILVVLVLLPILEQFKYPIGDFSTAEQGLLVDCLVLFWTSFVLGIVFKRSFFLPFVFLSACLLAAHYWASGLAKMQLNWWPHEQIAFLLPATYTNGWLGFLDEATVGALTSRLEGFNGVMKAYTLVLECGALFALWRRTTLRLFILGWMGLHLGIVLVTGIFFWKWMVAEAAFYWCFLRKRSGEPLAFFSGVPFVLSILLIAGAQWWCNPGPLAWYDARASYTYRFEAVGSQGVVYQLPPAYFAPFYYQFTLSGFGYLAQEPTLPIVWGSTRNLAVASAVNAAQRSDSLRVLESKLGTARFNPNRAQRFDRFMKQFVRWHNTHQGDRNLLRAVKAPRQLLTFEGPLAYVGQEKLKRVDVLRVTSFYANGRYEVVGDTLVRSIVIDD